MASPPPVPAQRPSGGPLAAPVIGWLFRAWSATWRVHRHGWEPVAAALEQGPCVLAFWHGEQVAIIGTHRRVPIAGMASLSPDGELLARVIAHLGYQVVRGSTSRGGKDAFEASRAAMDLGLTPALAADGPRGPRHRPHVGAVALSASAQRPVFWCVTRAWPVLRLRSWDRFEVPLPFARVELHYGLLDPAPDPADRAAVEARRVALGDRMRRRWAEVRGQPPAPLPAPREGDGPG